MKSPASTVPTRATAPLLTRASIRGGTLVGIAMTGLLLVLIFAPPFLDPAWRLGLMRAFHAVCHQLPLRSFHVEGVPLAVCHRCAGIYAGLFAGVLLFPVLAHFDGWLWKHARWLIIGALVPMGIDWLGDAVGLFANTILSRALTGAFFGVAVSYLLARGLAGLFPGRRTSAEEGMADEKPPSPVTHALRSS